MNQLGPGRADDAGISRINDTSKVNIWGKDILAVHTLTLLATVIPAVCTARVSMGSAMNGYATICSSEGRRCVADAAPR